MRLVVELSDEDYERAVSGELELLVEPIERVEVRQRDGLLSHSLRCRFAQTMSYEVAHNLGLPDGQPAITIWLAPERNLHVCNDEGRPRGD